MTGHHDKSDLIIAYIKEQEQKPFSQITIRGLAKGLNLSASCIKDYLNRLQSQGRVRWEHNRNRTLHSTDYNPNTVTSNQVDSSTMSGKVYHTVVQIIHDTGRPPTIQELADNLNMSSTGVYYHLCKLNRMRLIRSVPFVARSIRIV